MSDSFIEGQYYHDNGDYHTAAEHFAKSYRKGYERKKSLMEYGNCKFYEAASQLCGAPAITRRSVLITASRAFEDAIKEFGMDCECIYQLCCVEYSLGLLLNTKNGHTAKFEEYFNILKNNFSSEVSWLHELIPELENSFL